MYIYINKYKQCQAVLYLKTLDGLLFSAPRG